MHSNGLWNNIITIFQLNLIEIVFYENERRHLWVRLQKIDKVWLRIVGKFMEE